MRYPKDFTDASTIADRLENNLMPRPVAIQALADLEILRENKKVGYNEYDFLKMKLLEIINK